jgi:hypothetical protein
MMCVAQKPFTGNGVDYIRNELVDGSLFRNEQTLITQRILRPATKEEIESAVVEVEESAPAPLKAKKAKGGLKAKIGRR